MEVLLKYFDWVALLMASLFTSLALAVINQTRQGQRIHNGLIALVISAFVSVLLIQWKGFFAEWQAITLQFLMTILVSALISISRGQLLVDKFLGFLLDKAQISKAEDKAVNDANDKENNVEPKP